MHVDGHVHVTSKDGGVRLREEPPSRRADASATGRSRNGAIITSSTDDETHISKEALRLDDGR